MGGNLGCTFRELLKTLRSSGSCLRAVVTCRMTVPSVSSSSLLLLRTLVTLQTRGEGGGRRGQTRGDDKGQTRGEGGGGGSNKGRGQEEREGSQTRGEGGGQQTISLPSPPLPLGCKLGAEVSTHRETQKVKSHLAVSPLKPKTHSSQKRNIIFHHFSLSP